MERFMKLFEKEILTLKELHEIMDLKCVSKVRYNGRSGFIPNAYWYIVTIDGDEFYVYTKERA